MNALELRRRTLGKGVYKKTVEGNPAIAQGSLARMYPGITMQGWTEQDGTPTPEAPVPIVSAGTQNQDTGKWDYEITITNAQTDPDKNQSVTLTSDLPLTKWDKLEKRNGQWGWVYKSAEIVLDGTENYVSSKDYVSDFSSNCYTVISNMVSDGRTNAFMNRLSNIDYSWTQPDAIGFSKNRNQLHVRISNSDLGTTGESSASEITDAMKAYMAQQYEDGNPFIALYETAEETFAPLTTAEQEQMNALYTFRPTTVLSNDAGCNMTLTYKTKKSLEVTT